jgi:hypothetical protein
VPWLVTSEKLDAAINLRNKHSSDCSFDRVKIPKLTLRVMHWMQWLALMALIVGARFWLISRYGTALPIHDQWEVEAGLLFKPWLENTLRWSDLFAPHNEHRLVLTRLLALGLLKVNGQWDGLLEMTVNAILCGLIGVGFAAGLLRILGNEFRVPVLAVVALWLALPYAHENTLWGFQSQFYFLLFFSLLAIWGLGSFPAYSRIWWLGAIGAVLGCLSMASGFFAAAAILILDMVRVIAKRRRLPDAAPTFLFAIAVVALGLYFRTTFLPHEALKAASFYAWSNVFTRSLAWPYCTMPIVVVAMYLPWAICALLMLTTNEPRLRSRTEILFGIGLWVIMQAAAIAYARGENGNGPIASRYMDVLALGAVVNALCVVVLFPSVPWVGTRRTVAHVFGGLWVAAVFVGAAALGFQKLSSGPGNEVLLPMEENVRAYVATHDRQHLTGDHPYPDANRLAELLDDPTLRKILPAIIRPVLPLALRRETGHAFVASGYPAQLATPSYERSWGSYSQSGREARGSMETEDFRPALPYLQFEIAGALRDGTSLTLRDETGHEVRFNSPARLNENWRPAIVPVPGVKVHLVGNDDTTTRWFAFREPRELGRFSYYSQCAVANGKYLFMFSLGILTLMTLTTLRASPRF